MINPNNHFQLTIEMLAAAKLQYAQIDHGNGRSTLIVNGVHFDFVKGALLMIRKP